MVEKSTFHFLRTLLVILLLHVAAGAREKLSVHFFGSVNCSKCQTIIHQILKPIEEKYPDEVEIHLHYIEERGAIRLMMRMERQYGVKARSPQELFFADRYMTDYDDIVENAETLIEEYVGRPETWSVARKAPEHDEIDKELGRRVEELTLLGIMAAGLVDGVNPCAIATMIFLISFLALQKRRRLEILWIGLSYTAAVYVTYTLLGVGAFAVFTKLEAYRLVSIAVRWLAVAFAGLVAILSFWDAFRFKRTGEAAKITLQLPQPVKVRIHKIISGNLRRSQIFAGAVAAGFLVTLLEAVCTGQVYLPTIILMTRTVGFELRGWAYLLLYNFLFVLPLLVVMVLAYYGMTWEKLAAMTQKRLSLLKILVGSVMAGLAMFLAFS